MKPNYKTWFRKASPFVTFVSGEPCQK